MNIFEDMPVSVIIPVYNAASFVVQAVESALTQPETAEIILIEDGSPDNSLAVCRMLAGKYEKVRLLRHPGGKNKGAGASRNLGLKNAQFDFIAFLDADDFFLSGRFKVAKQIFETDPYCDGVYEATGYHFENEKIKIFWQNNSGKKKELTTINQPVPPEKLYKQLVVGKSGYFHLDGLVFKKSVIEKCGLMQENLFLHQDTEFIYRLSAVGTLRSGRLNEAVSIRRVHGHNRISAPRSAKQKFADRIKMWESTINWLLTKELYDKANIALYGMKQYYLLHRPFNNELINRMPKNILKKIRRMVWYFENSDIVLRIYLNLKLR